MSFPSLDLRQHLTLGSWEALVGRDVNPFAWLRYFQWVAEKRSRWWLPWHIEGVTFFSKLQIHCWVFSNRGRYALTGKTWQTHGLEIKMVHLWSSECGAGSLSHNHPHTPSLRQNAFVPVHETYYSSNSCRAIRKSKVPESDCVGLSATLNVIVNHAGY